jgi:hypothetical protein
LLVVVLLAFGACTGDTPSRRSAPTPSERVTAAPGGPSQSSADAERDGVPTEIAALPYRTRVNATTSVTVDDDRWVVSRPDRKAPIAAELAFEYGEVLRLDGRTIVRAFPFQGTPPQHLAVTPDATYCARQGDGGLPDSMVCRIDRDTLDLSVRIFPSEIDSGFAERDPETLPDGWTVDDEELQVRKLIVDDDGVWAQSTDESNWSKLDPDTLEIVERDIERVTTDP